MKATDRGSRVVNFNKSLVTHQDSERFLDVLKTELANGYGFVPLLGAGFSVPSGAPITEQIHAYLQRCVLKALIKPESGDRAWEPRTDRWPSFVNPEADKTPSYFSQLLDKYSQCAEEDPNRSVLQEGLGAMAEWRSALLFLSRLVRLPDHGEEGRLTLLSPQQEVIDGGLRVVIEGKNPSLEHRMLASLAGLLRLDVILTTNFDTMLERAFTEARNPLQVHDVGIAGTLPDWKAVSTGRSLIKLHGTASGLRADFSLDQRPTEVDRQHFVEYLTRSSGRMDEGDKDALTSMKNHLLVMGCSASEQRVRDFIEYAWANLGRDFRVFWICHSEMDVDSVCSFTEQFHEKTRSKRLAGETSKWEGSIVLRHTHLGLLLLQLYQSARQTLPPSGAIFPSISRLAVPPLAKAARPKDEALDDLEKRILDRIRSFFSKPDGHARIAAIWSRVDVAGVTTFGGDVFRALEKDHACLWVDMNDISKTDGLFETLLEAAYAKVGIEHWTPVYMTRDPRKRVAELARVADQADRPWVIFINARETPGANFRSEGSGHGWLDEEKGAQEFAELMVELCGSAQGSKNRRLAVVLLCRDAGTILLRTLTAGPLERASLFEFTHSAVSARDRVEEVVNDPNTDLRFLHALVLMQRPRFHSFISWYQQLHPGADPGMLKRTLEVLERKDIVRWKPGGFLWFHSQTRQILRHRLANDTDTALIHRELAGWYRRVLDASASPSAVFEVVHHVCQAALVDPVIDRRELDVCGATAVLRTYAWMIQTHGYSKGSCRRLEEARSVGDQIEGVSAEAKIKLKIICTEIMRSIAREVGEDSTAYARTRELRRLMALGHEKPDPSVSDSGAFRRAMAAGGAEEALQWVRWWRWAGMLGMASRSLDRGLAALTKALAGLTGHWNSRRPVDDLLMVIGADKWRAGRKEITEVELKQRFRIEALRVLEQYIQAQIVKLSVIRRLRGVKGVKAREQLVVAAVSRAVDVGKGLVEMVQAQDFSTGARNSVQARWCLSRILMHESGIADCGQGMGSLAAVRLLSEAEGCYKLADPIRFFSDLAIIELNRADAKLREAAGIPLPGRVTFGRWLFSGRDVRQEYVGNVGPGTTRQIKAIVNDAMRFLDRAEPVLRERRRNVWWTGWFFERKLRAISMLVAVAELEGFGGLIPYLGLTAAPAGGMTEPDVLLQNTMLMMRVDAYRLATVLEAYSSCAVSLMRYRVRRFGPDRRTLQERQFRMRERLKEGLERLVEVERRRPDSDADVVEPLYAGERTQPKSFQMDEEVKKYIDVVKATCRNTVGML